MRLQLTSRFSGIDRHQTNSRDFSEYFTMKCRHGLGLPTIFTPLVTLALGGCLLAFGCGDGRIPLGSISGKVTIDGVPLPAGQIIFVTDSRRAFGTIADGKIVEVTTYSSGDGVPTGNHKVAIRPKLDEAALMAPPKKSVSVMPSSTVPKKYHNSETSGLIATVESGSNELMFELSTN